MPVGGGNGRKLVFLAGSVWREKEPSAPGRVRPNMCPVGDFVFDWGWGWGWGFDRDFAFGLDFALAICRYPSAL